MLSYLAVLGVISSQASETRLNGESSSQLEPGIYKPSVKSERSGKVTYNPVKKTVADILANPVYHEIVEIEGVIEIHLEGNEYLFNDGTGRIVIEAGPPRFHRVVLPVGETITVIGQVDFDDGKPDLDIFKVILPDGREINVRGPGRLPGLITSLAGWPQLGCACLNHRMDLSGWLSPIFYLGLCF